MPVPGRFLENMGTHIFFKKGVPHTTRQLSGLWKNWAPSVDFFMAITLNSSLVYINTLNMFSLLVTFLLYAVRLVWGLDRL